MSPAGRWTRWPAGTDSSYEPLTAPVTSVSDRSPPDGTAPTGAGRRQPDDGAAVWPRGGAVVTAPREHPAATTPTRTSAAIAVQGTRRGRRGSRGPATIHPTLRRPPRTEG